MTIHAPIDTRIAERQAVAARHITRMRNAAETLEFRPERLMGRLAFLDALSFCIETDLSAEMDDLRHDLRIDREGFPTNDEGDRIPNAERRYVPLKSLERNAA
jgi:hypothetical protein